MQKIGRSLACAWILFLISEVFAVLIVVSLIKFELSLSANSTDTTNAPDESKKKPYDSDLTEEKEKPISTSHAWIMGLAMIVLNGHGMVIFRLIPRCKTRVMKYIHALVHTIVLGIAIYVYLTLRAFMDKEDSPRFSLERLHTILALITAAMYLFEWISGVAVYIYMYSNQRRRKLFASWHNFVGICILQFSIATSCVQVQELGYGMGLEELNAANAMVCMVIYGVLINCIVLNPFLEWQLVGPL